MSLISASARPSCSRIPNCITGAGPICSRGAYDLISFFAMGTVFSDSPAAFAQMASATRL